MNEQAEEKLASDLASSQICQQDPDLKALTDKYVSVVYQVSQAKIMYELVNFFSHQEKISKLQQTKNYSSFGKNFF